LGTRRKAAKLNLLLWDAPMYAESRPPVKKYSSALRRELEAMYQAGTMTSWLRVAMHDTVALAVDGRR
jgi:hypothetical protein